MIGLEGIERHTLKKNAPEDSVLGRQLLDLSYGFRSSNEHGTLHTKNAGGSYQFIAWGLRVKV